MKATHHTIYELTPDEIDIFIDYLAEKISLREAYVALGFPSRQHLYNSSANIIKQLWRDGVIGRINHPRESK